MHALVADHAEMRCVTRFGNHVGGVAANQHRLSGFKMVVIVEIEMVRMLGQAAVVIRDLAEILAAVFERELEGANRH